MNGKKPARTRRPRHAMPRFIRDALGEADLMAAYRDRPPYQQNDYIGITRAKRPETKEKRLAQMLDELAQGDRYMMMPYRAKARG